MSVTEKSNKPAPDPITGAEYKAFLDSKEFWPEGYCHDDVLLHIDGKSYGEDEELWPADIPDSAVVVIECGDVVFGGRRVADLEEYFMQWRDAQRDESHTLVVKAPKDRLEAIKAAVVEAGGVLV